MALNHRVKVVLILLVGLLGWVGCRRAQAQSVVYWYQPETINDITGRTACESGIPDDRTIIFAYGLGADTLSQPASWDVSQYTGLTVPGPKTQYQRGINATQAGGSAGQVFQQDFGLYVNSAASSNPNPVGNISGMVMCHSWKNYVHQRPWAYGDGARLRLQNNFQLTSRNTQGSIQYAMIYVSLADTVHWKSLWLTVSMFDSRGAIGDSINRDFGGTNNCNINTGFMPGRRYSTLVTGSQRMDGSGPGEWYAVDITRQNLINAIGDINKTLGENYSLNPDDYALNFIGSGLEEYVPKGQQGAFGGRIGQVTAMTFVPSTLAARVRDPFSIAGPVLDWAKIDSTRPVAAINESQALPSVDGAALALDGCQALLANETAGYKDTTVSCWILPLQGNLSIQGVLAAANSDFHFANTDAWFAGTFLRYQTSSGMQSVLRIWGNGGEVKTDFPGVTMAEVPAPANAADGNYHKLSLRINRDDVHPLLAILWDDVEQGHFGPDPSWNQRAPQGRAGIFTWFRSPGEQTRYDDFRATWDEVVTCGARDWALYR